jgi:MFS family permease
VKNGTETKWIICAQIVTALGLFLIPFSSNLFWAGFALSVFTAGNALARTVLVSLTTKESGGKYGTAAGMTYSMDNMGRIIGPLLFTWIFTQEAGNMYYISAVLAVLSIGLIFAFKMSAKSLRSLEETLNN